MNISTGRCRLRRLALLPVLGFVAITAPAARAAVDPATRHHHPDLVQPPTRIVTVEQAGAFDWADAGIGAAGGLGAALVAASSAVLLTRRRRATVGPAAERFGS